MNKPARPEPGVMNPFDSSNGSSNDPSTPGNHDSPEPFPFPTILWKLDERVKELTALHRTSRILDNDRRKIGPTMARVLTLIPPAWQYSEATTARIIIGRMKIRRTNLRLEDLVKQRTAELEEANRRLKQENEDRKKSQRKIRRYKNTLQNLVMQLGITEARERRKIAEDIHDHIGQALAIAKMRLQEVQGNAAFSGLEGQIGTLQKKIT